jgi:hypothetical protein
MEGHSEHHDKSQLCTEDQAFPSNGGIRPILEQVAGVEKNVTAGSGNDGKADTPSLSQERRDIAQGSSSKTRRGLPKVLCPLLWLFVTRYVQVFDDAGSRATTRATPGTDLASSWFIAGIILHRELGWVVPLLIWLAISIRCLTWFVAIKTVMTPARIIWELAVRRPTKKIPETWRVPLGGSMTVLVMVLGTFVPPDAPGNTRLDRAVSFLGLAVAIATFHATSKNRSKTSWQPVIVGLLTQFLLALFVLRTQVGVSIY